MFLEVSSLGVVVAEKIIDLSGLIAISSITLMFEFRTLKASLHEAGLKNLSSAHKEAFYFRDVTITNVAAFFKADLGKLSYSEKFKLS